MRRAFEERRDLMVDKLAAIEGMKVNRPKGAFYLFPDVSQFIGKKYNGQLIGSVDELSLMLLKEALVSTVTGRAFGDTNCIRISYANSKENLEKAAGRMQSFFQKIDG
jgi:aspartate aminotransferase